MEPQLNSEIFNPEQLILKVKMLRDKFPNIGIVCNGMRPIERKIEVCNKANPPAMQFRPENIEEMTKLLAGLNEDADNTSIHLDNLKFDTETGVIDAAQRKEIVEMIKLSANSNNFKLYNIHPGWKDASLVLDELGNWRETALANSIANELADLFAEGIKAGRVMAIENVTCRNDEPEKLGTKPEHMMAIRKKIAEIVSRKIKMPIEEALSKICYTFDFGHVVSNTQILKQYPIEVWFKKLGADIKLLHIHDVLAENALPDNSLPPDNKHRFRREHKSLGRGIVDWNNFFQLKNKYCPNAPMILEINNDNTGARTIESIEYLEKLEKKSS